MNTVTGTGTGTVTGTGTGTGTGAGAGTLPAKKHARPYKQQSNTTQTQGSHFFPCTMDVTCTCI